VRDYVHVSDLADAHVLALARALGSPAGFEAYNLGSGRGHSLDEIVAAARRVTGREVPVRYGERRPGDPSCLIGDAGKARAELGWEARQSELDTMLLHTWKWMLARRAEGLSRGRQPAIAGR
jgi:UDP-glucose 4-epimerase